MIQLFSVEEGISVLEEKGKNVLFQDSIRFGISKLERKFLFHQLQVVVRLLKADKSLDFQVKQGFLKKLNRNDKAKFYNMWEIRDPGRGGRLIFVLSKPNTIIVSAVTKHTSTLHQAVQRGVKRWEKYLKQKKSV